jgi:hypothetical protein
MSETRLWDEIAVLAILVLIAVNIEVWWTRRQQP